MINNSSEDPRLVFLKYAFPCAFIAVQRGEISLADHDLLERMSLQKIPLDPSLLEKVFFRAVERMHKNADAHHFPRWSVEAVRSYFVENHNHLIDTNQYMYGKAPLALKELCRVQIGKIIDTTIEGYGLVRFKDGKMRPVHLQLVPDAKVGDAVTVHYSYACERRG